MIRKLVRQMLAAQIFSALTVSVCLLIDNIMIARFLGEECMAAYGFANPILLALGAIGSLLSAGIQVACSKSLGRGSQEETNAGYSTAVVLVAGISAVFMASVLLFRSPLATAMGAGHEGSLFEQTSDYMAGFIIGAPGSMGALVLVPFMQMAGQSGLLIAAVLSMTLADIALDLLNVYVFHAGMFGMGLASSLSYYLALIVGGFYFLSRRCVFRFSWKRVTWRKALELFRGGIPAGVNMVASVVFVYLMNQILKSTAGSMAIAAFTVISSLGNAANCITTGIGGVSLTLSGIFYHEEDRTSLKELLKLLIRYSVVLGLCMGTVLLIFSPSLVSLFITAANDTQAAAILGLRLYAAGLIPCCINNALKFSYQATGRVALSEIISMAEGALFPAAAAFLLSHLAGLTGAWLYFVCGEVLTLTALMLYVWRRGQRSPVSDGAYLLLRGSFGVADDHLLEADIVSRQDVAEAAERAAAFCVEHGQSQRLSNHIALCVEEMASNTVQHGFNQDQKPHHLFLRVLHKPDTWVIRFRDDCTAFDPVHYVPEQGKDALGLRLVRALANDVSYTYSMNMNNLTIRLPAEQPEARDAGEPSENL